MKSFPKLNTTLKRKISDKNYLCFYINIFAINKCRKYYFKQLD